MSDIQPSTRRVLVALDVPAEQATDPDDLVASIHARLIDEAGYLDPDGEPVTPTVVVVAYVGEDDLELDATVLRGAYEVGAEGLRG